MVRVSVIEGVVVVIVVMVWDPVLVFPKAVRVVVPAIITRHFINF
jgi:hypothetical protein